MGLFGMISFINEEPGRDGFSQTGWCQEWSREALVPSVGRGVGELPASPRHCFGPAASQLGTLCALLLSFQKCIQISEEVLGSL